MTISDFYTHPTICATIGRAKIRKTFSALRDLLPEAINTKEVGQFPWFYKPVNTYYAAWILYTLCNSNSCTREDVAASIGRGIGLRYKDGGFIDWLSQALGSDILTDSIEHITIYNGTDCRAIAYLKGPLPPLYFNGKGYSNGLTKSTEINGKLLTQLAIELKN